MFSVFSFFSPFIIFLNRHSWVVHALVASTLLIVILHLIGPWWSVYQFDLDEGLCLIKSILVSEGWILYQDIWNDQPPFLTFIQAAIFWIFTPDVILGRAIILFFSMLAIISLFRIVFLQAGIIAAWLGVLLLISGYLFLRLSVSSMIGLPSIALIITSMSIAIQIKSCRDYKNLIFSGVLASLSLATKLFVMPMVLGVAFIIFINISRPNMIFVALYVSIIWLTLVFVVLVGIFLPFGESVIHQLFDSHSSARASGIYRHLGGFFHLWTLMKQHPQYLFFGLTGLFITLFDKKNRYFLIGPLAWFLGNFLALALHQPIWYHHLLLLHIPCAWLAGLGAGSVINLWKNFERNRCRSKIPILALCIFGLITAGYFSTLSITHQLTKLSRDFSKLPSKYDLMAVAALSKYKNKTTWVLTDYPMDTVRAGLLSIPPTAVYPAKRVTSKNITQKLLIKYIKEYRPEQISYRRFFMGKKVKSYLDKHYLRLETNPEQMHYILREFSKNNN